MIEKGFFSVGLYFFVFSIIPFTRKFYKPRKEDRDMCVYTYMTRVGWGGSGAGWCACACVWRIKRKRLGEIWRVDMVGSRLGRWPIGVIGRRGLMTERGGP